MEKQEIITGRRYLEIMWPLNDLFRPRLHEIRALPYDPEFEAEADAAIERMAEDAAGAWAGLSPGAWRVLLERHLQMLVVATANMAVGNRLMTLPPGPPLTDEELRVALALLWLLQMKLPFPAVDRSLHEFPPQPPAKTH